MSHRSGNPFDIRKISAAEYVQLAESGFFEKGERVELIDGIMRFEESQSPPHTFVITQINRWFVRFLEDDCAWIQLPIVLTDFSVVQPDAAIVSGPIEKFETRFPNGLDTKLVIEVSEESLFLDAGQKMRFYAEAEVPEYWIVDLRNRQVQIHTEPRPDGYGVIHIVSEFHEVAPLAFPNSPIEVVKLLPPKTA